MQKQNQKCSFCGESFDRNEVFFGMASNAIICKSCIEKATLINEYISVDDSVDSKSNNLTPKKIMAYLDRFVVGQFNAKKTLSVSAFNHINKFLDDDSFIHTPKSNILLIGDSGVGKTLLVEKLAEIADIPFVIADATSMTQAGYSGEDVSTCLKQLLVKAGGNIEKAQRGIVFIDEVDKIAARGTAGGVDVSGRSVQQSLLKLIEGKEVQLSTKGIPTIDANEVMFDTKETLFIAGGAFEGLKDLKITQNRSQGIGFIKDNKYSAHENTQLPDEVLVKYGMIPEFIGRFSLRVGLDTLTKKDMFKIISATEGGILHTYRALLKKNNISLEVDECVINYAASQAIKLKVGARAVNRILQPVFDDVIFDNEGFVGVEKIHLRLKEDNTIEYVATKKNMVF